MREEGRQDRRLLLLLLPRGKSRVCVLLCLLCLLMRRDRPRLLRWLLLCLRRLLLQLLPWNGQRGCHGGN